MRNARSAKVLVALGATLIAAAAPAFAASLSLVSGFDSVAVYGIDSGDGYGIDSGDGYGIDSGDGYGIDSGDGYGIDSGDGYGIDSGDGYGIDSGDGYGIDSGDGYGIDSADVLAGPVDAIDRSNGVFHSLGQVVMASDETLNSLQVGDFVNVQGSIVSEGWLYADTVSVAAIDYVPGATEVFVAGMLSQVDSANGTARLGGLTIDYTPSLAVGSSPSDATWSFRGTRPAMNGPMVSEFSNDFRAR